MFFSHSLTAAAAAAAVVVMTCASLLHGATAQDALKLTDGPDCSATGGWDISPVVTSKEDTIGVPYSPRIVHNDSNCDGPNRVCFYTRVNLFVGETGYYVFDGAAGLSPDLHVRVGTTLVFEQYDETNWMHALGFAFYPDGAHGKNWGGEERAEVEDPLQLRYFTDGVESCGPGDTGLDCFEPEFFYPREDWQAKRYRVELTITPELAAASHGGVLYYFCHIHSKMSGRIVILGPSGLRIAGTGAEEALYPTASLDPVDRACGTVGLAPFAPGREMACEERFVCGNVDTNFEKCLQAMDCQMNREMRTGGHDDHGDPLLTFCRQMIPHHRNAVNMARTMLKHVPRATLEDSGFYQMMHEIINSQNYQVHVMYGYLGQHGDFPGESDDAVPATASHFRTLTFREDPTDVLNNAKTSTAALKSQLAAQIAGIMRIPDAAIRNVDVSTASDTLAVELEMAAPASSVQRLDEAVEQGLALTFYAPWAEPGAEPMHLTVGAASHAAAPAAAAGSTTGGSGCQCNNDSSIGIGVAGFVISILLAVGAAVAATYYFLRVRNSGGDVAVEKESNGTTQEKSREQAKQLSQSPSSASFGLSGSSVLPATPSSSSYQEKQPAAMETTFSATPVAPAAPAAAAFTLNLSTVDSVSGGESVVDESAAWDPAGEVTSPAPTNASTTAAAPNL